MKTIVNRIIGFVLVIFLGSCNLSTQGVVSNIREKSLLVNYADSKEKVLEVLGTPGDRSFSGSTEAWQYCSTSNGFTPAIFAVIWFENGTVVGLTNTTSATASIASCNSFFPDIDWGQKPADRQIDINLNSN